MISKGSITRRWLLNSLGVILLVMITLIATLSLVVQGYVYNGIQWALNGRSEELTNMFAGYGRKSPSDFSDAAGSYVQDFPDKERMELMVLNSSGRVTVTSIGFAPDQSQPVPDYKTALADKNGYGTWTGRLTSGEKVMAVTRVVHSDSGTPIGAVRYVVSLEEADRQIILIIGALVAAGILIILFVIFSSYYFMRSIITPIKRIGATASLIAQGDFNARIEKSNDDEIGQLCDTINDMAVELGQSEKMKNDFISSVSH